MVVSVEGDEWWVEVVALDLKVSDVLVCSC